MADSLHPEYLPLNGDILAFTVVLSTIFLIKNHGLLEPFALENGLVVHALVSLSHLTNHYQSWYHFIVSFPKIGQQQ